MAQWYYAQNGQQVGPVSFEDLKQLAARRQIQPNDHVFQVGTPNWVPASTVPDLFPAVPPPPPRRGADELEPIDDEAPGDNVALKLWSALSWHVNQMPVSPSEESELRRQSTAEPTVQRYLVWRRALLYFVVGLTIISALLGTVNQLKGLSSFRSEMEKTLQGTGAKIAISPFGMLVLAITILGLFAMPVAALLATLNWSRPRLSYRMMLLGWAIAFLLPLFMALIPIRWQLSFSGISEEAQSAITKGFGLLLSLSSMIVLITIVLSLVGGTVAGAIRVKSLLPGSIVPGWFMLGACSLQALMLFVVFTTVNYLASAPLLIVAMLCYLGAITAYLVNWKTFVRPLSNEASNRSLNQVRLFNLGFVSSGTLLFFVYLFTTKFRLPGDLVEKNLVAFSSDKGMMSVWSLLEYYIGYLGRLLFITVLACDLLNRINLSVSNATTRFTGTPEAEKHNAVLTELDATLKRD